MFLQCMRVSVLTAVVVGSGLSVQAEFKTTGVPEYDEAVRRAVAYLGRPDTQIPPKATSLVAYALLKAGVIDKTAAAGTGIRDAIDRASRTGYHGYEHAYWCGVDAMLLADLDAEKYRNEIQAIADHVSASQREDGSWAENGSRPGDVSMAQYAMLALWAAERSGCQIRYETVDRAARWLIANVESDGGWTYRPGTDEGRTHGQTSHTMTMAGASSLAIARLMFYGRRMTTSDGQVFGAGKPKLKFGVLETVKEDGDTGDPNVPDLGGFQPTVSRAELDRRIRRAFAWNEARFEPAAEPIGPKNYYYYTLERAAAIHGVSLVKGKDLYRTYGDGLLTLQAEDGSFSQPGNVLSGPIGTCFAILYFVRSTKSILDRQYGRGSQVGGRGLENIFGGRKKKPTGPLNELLASMSEQNFADLDLDIDDVVESIQFSSRDELVGQTDTLRKLMKHPDPEIRRIACWAIGRTSQFDLIPLLMDGLRDPSLDVNIEALLALRYIARRPDGFGLTLEPLAGTGDMEESARLQKVAAWRQQAWRTWNRWYRRVRPWEEGGGLDELLLPE